MPRQRGDLIMADTSFPYYLTKHVVSIHFKFKFSIISMKSRRVNSR